MQHFTPVKKPMPCVIITGGEGSRKTTLAMTAPGPIYVIGTEEGHEQDTIFRVKGDKQVFITDLKYERAEKYPSVWFGAYKGLWEQVMGAVNELLNAPSGSVVFDSATDLFGMAAAHFNYTFERGDKPVPSLAYGQVYPLLRDVINLLRGKHNIILTARLKDVYRNNEQTGEKTLGLWKDAEYLAEHIWYMHVDEGTQVAFAQGTKGSATGAVVADPTWDKLISADPLFGKDDREFYEILRQLPQAYQYLDQNRIPYKRAQIKTAEDARAHMAQLSQLANPSPQVAASTNGAVTA